MAHSLERHASRPVRVSPFIDWKADWLQRGSPAGDPDDGVTPFRIAETKGFAGTAVTVTACAIARADIVPLLAVPFEDAAALVPAGPGPGALPAVEPDRPGTSPIATLRCDRDVWARFVSERDGRASPLPSDRIRRTLPPAWAGTSHDPAAPLLAYRSPSDAPWRNARAAGSLAWLLELRLMLDGGRLGWRQVEEEIAAGHARPSLIEELREMPHLNGIDRSALDRYAALDAERGSATAS